MIKILRLKNESDIICTLEEIRNGEYVITDPMYFELQTRGGVMHIVMDFYLPIQVLERNEVVIKESDVLFQTTPSQDFMEYYMNSVESVKKMKPEGEFEEGVDNELNARIKEMVVEAFMEMDPEDKVFH
jgi:hypothetical protein